MSRTCGFTLIELLVATMLSVVLMGGVLVVLGGLSRDVKKMAGPEVQVDGQPVIDMFQWDLSNARTMIQAPDARTLILIGHGAIDRDSLAPTGRLVRVTYSCRVRGKLPCLMRQQEFLDEPARPRRWIELVASGVTRVSVVPAGAQTPPPDPQVLADGNDLPAGVRGGVVARVPQWVRVQVSGPSVAVEKLLCVK